MSHSALSVANYFIHKSLETGVELTPMKALKLVYIAHGWHLALYKKPLISESVQAWKYGPVVQSVYSAFRAFKDSQITMTAPVLRDSLTSEDNEFLDKIWDVYKDFSGIELSHITHQKDTPWDIVWNKKNGKNRFGALIPDSLIESHYKELAGIEQ